MWCLEEHCDAAKHGGEIYNLLSLIPNRSARADQVTGTHNVSDMTKLRFRMPPVCFIVARSNAGNVIGCEGQLPWKLKTDLHRFRTLTAKHAVIMGRKTFESIGRPLPNRLNVVVSRSANLSHSEIDLHGTATKLMHSKSAEDALFCSDIFTILNDSKQIFVIGGSEIYRRFSPIVDRIYLTEVLADVEGDAFFHEPFDEREWKLVKEEGVPKGPDDEYPSRFLIFDKKISADRLRSFSDIAQKKERNHVCMKSITNSDAKIIEEYAASQIGIGIKSQLRFTFS